MNICQYLLKLKYCKPFKDEDLLRHFGGLTDSLDVHNIFNPSFYCDNDVKIFSFRAIPNGTDRLDSFISIEDKAGRLVKNISLELSEELNAVRLIDPKVFKINEAIYITFNSGWIPEGNDIFIMKIYPKIESSRRIIYKSRRKQERNWAFFSENGEIYALYWINPLKVLKVKNMGSDSWEMEDFYCGEHNKNLSRDLTIGTQLVRLDGKYYFVSHKKCIFLRKKIYLGKLCMLDFNKKYIKAGRYWLAHSFKSLFGSKIKYNTNLFSCTYFSGIQASDDSIKLGYGINDVNYCFSSYKSEEFFKNEKE